ncbi:MAG: TatD family hydrolase [Mollicutes bacterium]|jgi:TatD DNase family protein|nr:TatD family hydrolase [Mollicutes bacterium]
MVIDTHCHLFKDYYNDLDEVIKRMGNNIIIVSGTSNETNIEVIELCNKYKNVYGTLGIHPTEIDKYKESDLLFIVENINNPKIVGIGEIGLDYYWTKENKEIQKEIFKKQLDLAKRYNKTIVIHTREAIMETYNILKEANLNNNKIVMHCYSGSLEMAKEFIKLGAMLGIGGVVTFKNARNIVEIVKVISLDKILLETDSPFLTPEPYRSKRNEPKNVLLVAKKIAEIKGIDVNEICCITTKNAVCQFDLKGVM